ncbi:MerR family transcriptional regulator (plasmid) [Streptomyces sp. NBC_00841]|uniref:MerR family transcriptional regulator n=1 Tax=Streptomyces sp. NBC_00841 TaxID=2975847 RepID=UPI002DD9F635|nr:MerR family transcriptional regulator [Streptomyces sp. NBC_00841]WSA05995.1 MerR family transcriptional regulator [Streptomyces sp. NBC_00841]
MDTDLLTTDEAAAHTTRARQLLSAGAAAVRPTTIRSWASRGYLPRAGLTETGRPLYRLADVARAEAVTRNRALRLVGIPENPSFGLGGAAISHSAQRTPQSGTTTPDPSVGK